MSAGWGNAPETFPYHCQHCNDAVNLVVVGHWQNIPGEGDGYDPHKWTSARCLGCGSPYLLYQEPDWALGAHDWGEREQIYPATDRKLMHPVPASIREDYDEARRCMRARCYTAAAIMARRCVESIRHLHGHKTGSLYKALEAMKDANQIDPRLYEWADAVREVGNEGAHDTDRQVSREDAEEVLLYVEALCDYLYVFQHRYEAFKARREAVREGRDPLAITSFSIVDKAPTWTQAPQSESAAQSS